VLNQRYVNPNRRWTTRRWRSWPGSASGLVKFWVVWTIFVLVVMLIGYFVAR
jgi:hypothetical protein